MVWPSRQVFVIGCILLLAGALVLALAAGSRQHVIDAAFWFDPVTYDASEPTADRLGGDVTEDEMKTIASVASSEITSAFAGLPSGESRSIARIGGQGAVNFRILANGAVAYAPADANRATIIAAIGRGIGRAAVHKFAHQLLGTAPIHDTNDVQSYEDPSADRREQYYGEMHWDIAWPMLQKRMG